MNVRDGTLSEDELDRGEWSRADRGTYDRDGSSKSIVKKRQRRLSGDEIYVATVSKATEVFHITDKVFAEVQEWAIRPRGGVCGAICICRCPCGPGLRPGQFTRVGDLEWPIR